MNIRRTCYIIATISLISGAYGCQESSSHNPETQQANLQQVEQQQTDQAQDGQTNQVDVCPKGSTASNQKCICKDGSEWLGEGWDCIDDAQVCNINDGCEFNGIRYPQGITIQNHVIVNCKNGSVSYDDKCLCDNGSEWLGYGWKCEDGRFFEGGYQRCILTDGCDANGEHHPRDKKIFNENNENCVEDAVFYNNKCICDDGSEPLGDGWDCEKKCVSEDGCDLNGKHYPTDIIFISNDKVMCGEREWLGEGWSCDWTPKCINSNGCDLNNKHYPKNTHSSNNNVLCGDNVTPDTVNDYDCTDDKEWECNKEQCLCDGDTIEKNKICKIVAKDCPNGTKYSNKKCICGDDTEWYGEGWYCLTNGQQKCMLKSGCDFNDEHYKIGDKLPKQDDDEADNNENEIDDTTPDGKNNCPYYYSLDLDEDDIDDLSELDLAGYICENNAWVCKSRNEKGVLLGRRYNSWRDYFCGGIPLSSINIPQSSDRISASIPDMHNYTCRYTHWVCEGDYGCSCFDGYKEQYIHYGDICVNKLESCIDSPWPENAADVRLNSFEEINTDYLLEKFTVEFKNNDQICLEDSCPCGDGACMKFGQCIDNKCQCGDSISTNDHDEFYCKRFYYAFDDPYIGITEGQSMDGITGTILYCAKEGGCHTRDGRHYPQGTKLTNVNDLNDAQLYHIDAGFDTTLESTSEIGECVLDRKDNIQRFSDISIAGTQSAEFICDHNTCICGINTCKIGDICRHGKCEPDSCNANELSKLICDVRINDGQRSYPNPDNPNQCIYFQYARDFGDDYLDNGDFTDPEEAIRFDEELEAHLDHVGYRYSDIFGFYFDVTDADPEQIEEAKKELYEEMPGKLYYDVKECKGGHRYCHGLNNSPIRIPDSPEGYECLTVNSLPDVSHKDNLKAWVCTSDNGCMCGKNTCGYNKACMNEQCIDVNLQSENNKTIQKLATGESDHGTSYTNRFRCWCHGKAIKCGETCISDNQDDNQKVHVPQPCCHDGQSDKNDVCWCGDNKIYDPENEMCLKIDDQFHILCHRPEGCICGRTKCPMTTYCDQGKCIDPLTSQPISDSSKKLAPIAACADHIGCSCESTKCDYGQFCIGGICSDYFYSNIFNGKRYYYNLLAHYNAPPYHYDPYRSNIKDIDTSQEDIKEHSDIFSKMKLPADEYALASSKTWKFIQSKDYTYSDGPEKFRCALSSGCSCGDQKCHYGAECIDGKCVYDLKDYFKTYCDFEDLGGYEPDCFNYDISVNDSYCYCEGMVHQPITSTDHTINRYVCDGLGWICYSSECECGDIRCKKGEYCIKPDICANINE